jgi:hypothetical protein
MRIAGAPLGRLDRTLGSGRIGPQQRREYFQTAEGIRLPFPEPTFALHTVDER